MMTTYRWKWLHLWELGNYSLEFTSPHPLETCKKILRDQSQRGYFEYGGRDFLHPDLRNRGVFVDVNTEQADKHTFRIEKEFGDSLKQRAFLEATGTLTRLEDGTRVEVTIRRGGAWGIIVMGVCFIWLILLCGTFSPPMTSPIWLHILIWLQPVIWGGWFWRMRLHPFIQFVESLEKWLGEPSTPIRQALKPVHHPFQAKFDFYTSDSIITCVEKLTPKPHTQHYQLTHLGMKHGISVNGELFISRETNETGERQYLLIERNMWLAHSSLYNSSVRVLGTLETEGDMTHVYGYSYLPRGWWYIGSFMVMWIVLLISAIAWSPIMLLLGMGLTIIGYTILKNRIHNMNRYPEIIQSSHRAQNRFDGMSGLYTFDFHSPYPPVECVNMLLDYSPAKEYPSQWGVSKEVTLKNHYRVVVTQTDEAVKFSIYSEDKYHLAHIEAIGILQSEGYGTSVSGHCEVVHVSAWMSMMIFVTITILALLTNFAGFPLSILVIILGWRWYILSMGIKRVGKYPQQLLGSKGGRKGKEKEAKRGIE